MALLRLIVVVAVALFLLGAWASQATAHTNHVNKASLKLMTNPGRKPNRNYPQPAKKSPKSPGNFNNNGGTPNTQVVDPSVNSLPNANTVDAINNVVEKATETMAEPPQLSGTCDGNGRAFGGWLAVIIAVSLYYHHRL
ncbi:uncharacterized protein LOC116033009 isoform X2 [Ipomoea triloba]|uniref:uncharacterized protein LOC116033009 isoform X2 n=1 Tax=Ipomoea triloba TaxID=35885 RepID=UPI00125E58B4|nr:uncharacterized protein LOC116033009 isoform X2 [Ipomoea triloba]